MRSCIFSRRRRTFSFAVAFSLSKAFTYCSGTCARVKNIPSVSRKTI
jgi:hypothetical protein